MRCPWPRPSRGSAVELDLSSLHNGWGDECDRPIPRWPRGGAVSFPADGTTRHATTSPPGQPRDDRRPGTVRSPRGRSILAALGAPCQSGGQSHTNHTPVCGALRSGALRSGGLRAAGPAVPSPLISSGEWHSPQVACGQGPVAREATQLTGQPPRSHPPPTVSVACARGLVVRGQGFASLPRTINPRRARHLNRIEPLRITIMAGTRPAAASRDAAGAPTPATRRIVLGARPLGRSFARSHPAGPR